MKRMRLRDDFITGIFIILPAVVTIWVLSVLWNAVNGTMVSPVMRLLRPYLSNVYLEYAASTIVLVLFVVVIVLIGAAMRVLFIRKFLSGVERLFYRLPMVGKVYITMKQISGAFLGERKGLFQSPVLIEYPRKGIYSIGFLTTQNKGEIPRRLDKKVYSVFVPTTPNPTSGILILAPENEITPLTMSVEEAMKLVISGGVVSPDEIAFAGR